MKGHDEDSALGWCRKETVALSLRTLVNLYETLLHSFTTALSEILQNPLDMA
jgi:hypothetical protein